MQRKFLLAFLLLFFIFTPCIAQWKKLTQPEGGTVYSLCRSDSAVYAAVNSRVYRSSDPLFVWEDISFNLPDLQSSYIEKILCHSDKIYALNFWGNLLVWKEDSMKWWMPAPGAYFDDIALIGETLYLVSTELQYPNLTDYTMEIYKSSDGGDNIVFLDSMRVTGRSGPGMNRLFYLLEDTLFIAWRSIWYLNADEKLVEFTKTGLVENSFMI